MRREFFVFGDWHIRKEAVVGFRRRTSRVVEIILIGGEAYETGFSAEEGAETMMGLLLGHDNDDRLESVAYQTAMAATDNHSDG